MKYRKLILLLTIYGFTFLTQITGLNCTLKTGNKNERSYCLNCVSASLEVKEGSFSKFGTNLCLFAICCYFCLQRLYNDICLICTRQFKGDSQFFFNAIHFFPSYSFCKNALVIVSGCRKKNIYIYISSSESPFQLQSQSALCVQKSEEEFRERMK